MSIVRPLFAITFAAGCASAPTQGVTTRQEFDARAGETVRIAGSATSIAIGSINDSRCPADASCIWAGDAVVTVSFSGDAGVQRDTLRLTAPPRSVSYGSLRLELLAVNPYPLFTQRERVPSAMLRVTTAP